MSWLTLVRGGALLVMAAKQWRGRPRGDEVPTPKWMETVDVFTPVKAFGAGVVLSDLNPKNLILKIAGMAAIVQAAIPAGEEAEALAVFTGIGSIGVAAPVVIFFALGEHSGPPLNRLKAWMASHSAVIMTVLLVLIGAKLIGDAIGGLSD